MARFELVAQPATNYKGRLLA